MSLQHSDYLKMCLILAEASHCKRSQVGGMLVKDGNIIAQSYNGTVSGSDNNCEDEEGNTKAEVLHCESQIIAKMAKSTQSCEGAILYCTLAPCLECAKLIVQSGIKEVYFLQFYRLTNGVNFLTYHGIRNKQI